MLNTRTVFIFLLLITAFATLSLVSAQDSCEIVNASCDEVGIDSSISVEGDENSLVLPLSGSDDMHVRKLLKTWVQEYLA